MANLIPAIQKDDIYQLETTDDAIGGEGGLANLPQQNLLNRLSYLDRELELYHALRNIHIYTSAKHFHIAFSKLLDRSNITSAAPLCTSILKPGLTFDDISSNTWLYLYLLSGWIPSPGNNNFLLSDSLYENGFLLSATKLCKRLIFDSISTPFHAGEIVAGQSSAASGKVIVFKQDPQLLLALECYSTTAFQDGETVHGDQGGDGVLGGTGSVSTGLRSYVQRGNHIHLAAAGMSPMNILDMETTSSTLSTSWTLLNLSKCCPVDAGIVQSVDIYAWMFLNSASRIWLKMFFNLQDNNVIDEACTYLIDNSGDVYDRHGCAHHTFYISNDNLRFKVSTGAKLKIFGTGFEINWAWS